MDDDIALDSEIKTLLEEAVKTREQLGKTELARLRDLHWLRCARCGLQLETVSYQGLRIERCFNCGGTFLDAGELEKLAQAKTSTVHGLVDRLKITAARASSGQWSIGSVEHAAAEGARPSKRSSSSSQPIAGGGNRDATSALAGAAFVFGLLVLATGYVYFFEQKTWSKIIGKDDASQISVSVGISPALPAPTLPPGQETKGLVPTPKDGAVVDEERIPPGSMEKTPSNPSPDEPPQPKASSKESPEAQEGRDNTKPVGLETAQGQEGLGYNGHLRSGRAALERGQTKKALRHFEAAIAHRPRQAPPYVGLGWVFINLKQPHIALLKFKQALKKNPKHGDGYIGLGKAYRLLGQKEKARAAYRKYLDLRPEGPSASIAKNAIENLSP